MTSNDAFYSEPQPSDYTIALDGLVRIFAAARGKPTRFVRQKEVFQGSRIGRQISLIEADGVKKYRLHYYVIFDSLRRPDLRRSSRTKRSTRANSSPNPFRTINTPSHPGAMLGRASRTDSRTSRRTRFRLVARLSMPMGTTKANRLDCRFRVNPESKRRRYTSCTPSAPARRPARMTDVISGEGSLYARGNISGSGSQKLISLNMSFPQERAQRSLPDGRQFRHTREE